MKKILLTLGAMVGTITPIAAVVACGKEEDEKVTSTIKGSQFKNMFLKANVKGELKTTSEFADFLSKIATNNNGKYEVPNKNISSEKFKEEVQENFKNDKVKTDALINILKANKNNAELATSCLIFTTKTITGEEMAKFGLAGFPTPSQQDIKKLNDSIEGGNIIAQEIADSIIRKFNTAKNDPMWNDTTLGLVATIEEKPGKHSTFVEGSTFASLGQTMAGRENLKIILTSSGYGYEEAKATKNN